MTGPATDSPKRLSLRLTRQEWFGGCFAHRYRETRGRNRELELTCSRCGVVVPWQWLRDHMDHMERGDEAGDEV